MLEKGNQEITNTRKVSAPLNTGIVTLVDLLSMACRTVNACTVRAFTLVPTIHALIIYVLKDALGL